jgi:hypothetical protein
VQNSIHNLDTKVFQNATGEFPAVVMGLNIRDTNEANAFITSAVEKWKLQRMCSPPDTANMTITVAGDMTAAQFRESWLRHVDRDPILKLFMSMMRHASVLHIRGEEFLDEASLLISSDAKNA